MSHPVSVETSLTNAAKSIGRLPLYPEEKPRKIGKIGLVTSEANFQTLAGLPEYVIIARSSNQWVPKDTTAAHALA